MAVQKRNIECCNGVTKIKQNLVLTLVLVVFCLINVGESTTYYKLVAQNGEEIEAPLGDFSEFEKSPVPATAIMSAEGEAQPPLSDFENEKNSETNRNIELEASFTEEVEDDVVGAGPTQKEDIVEEQSGDGIFNTTRSSDDLLEGEEEAKPAIQPPRIPYSKPRLNRHYKSEDKFHPRGMEHLYLITNLFLQLVHREVEMPDAISKYSFFINRLSIKKHEDNFKILFV